MKLIMYVYKEQLKLYDEESKKIIIEDENFEYFIGYVDALNTNDIYERKNIQVIEIDSDNEMFHTLGFNDDKK